MSRRPSSSLFGPLAFSSAFGILMVVTAVRPAGADGTVALGVSAAALVAGVFFRPAATVAVLASIVAMALTDPEPLFAAVSGMAAAVYLMFRYAVSGGGRGGGAGAPVALTMPTVVCLVGFAIAGLVPSLVGVRLSWVALLAPMIVVGILVLVALPLWADDRTGALPAVSGERPE